MSEYYIRRVHKRVSQLLDEWRNYLPDEEFTVQTSWQGKHETRLVIELVSLDPRGHWVCDEPLTEIVDILNREFESDRHYNEIEMVVSADWVDGFGDNIEYVGIGSEQRIRRSDHG